jgi:hypothetical protein
MDVPEVKNVIFGAGNMASMHFLANLLRPRLAVKAREQLIRALLRGEGDCSRSDERSASGRTNFF